LDNIRFFDCSASFGRRKNVHKGSFFSLDELLQKMAYYRIDGAMVYHSMAAEYEPNEGNQMLLDQIAGIHNLKPVWVVMPHHTGEFPHPLNLRELMKQNNIRAVRMMPGDSGYSLAGWSCGALFKMLEGCNVPVMLGVSQINRNYQILNDVLAAHPDMKLILTDIPYHCARYVYPLLECFPNLYLETIGFKVFGGIEDVCKKFGAGRLIFGSNAPLYSGGSAIGMIQYAKISQEEKKAIACENLEKLLEGVSL